MKQERKTAPPSWELCGSSDWEERVQAIEAEGATRSDAQSVVEAEDESRTGEMFAYLVDNLGGGIK
ncbi:hypothetical protein UFOVP1346_60 [uncultured Caudovirales phage]|uniref:Uncharacterized protein n=1 Tax=uncultured Caudovirales phage TaxID=2100421 RepID=A0A6J5QUD7_9CAUD|nr:hypothetical protein UFOVP921_40 [uncultured Caudovirales phage]CAB4187342.1 hypothetical protein UFOVP1156_16 [uncultured Caudovirales phage]CAB4200704.1 hypothetical protein UFOVP1346_60 [uncultured Caudovirales phage]